MPTTQPDFRMRVDCLLGDDHERALANDVLEGLARPCKELSPKHFYDARGAELFERICELPEYYLTRTERAILASEAEAISVTSGAAELVELGAGSAAKTRILLDALAAAGTLQRYVPMDVCESALRETAEALVSEYGELLVHGVVGDFDHHLDRLPPACGPRLVVLLGSTIGNYPPAARRQLLRRIAALLGPDDRLLLGTDLVKDRSLLLAAYDDDAGVTAQFNRNVLEVINQGLGANFRPSDFEHVARYDAEQQWVEMRLRARRAHEVTIPALDLRVRFAPGEELRTEISAKFTRERVAADYAAAGLSLAGWYTDPSDWFALSLAASTTRGS